ncbi:protein phosphatase methylesterase 1, partial [Tremellales sp. Uapishka_1]
MSDLFRNAMLNKLPTLPPTRAPWADESEELEQEDTMGELGAALPPSHKYQQDVTPLSAADYFAQALQVQPPSSDTTFRVYLTPSSPTAGGKETYLICHHGGGASGLSFAMLAKEVEERSKGELGVLSFDARGHGKTSTAGPREADSNLSLSTLLSDLLSILQHMFPDPKTAPCFILLGHSMGAAPILASCPILQEKGYTICGVVVLDVVEGTAMDALPNMKTILNQRPHTFRSVEEGIAWHINTNSIRNPTSARISVPSFLIPDPEASPESTKQIWRTHLLGTEPYWKEWYHGLSAGFLGAKCARLLVLAGRERLDKELMVGQMQGKFQLDVMSDAGHYLHEDDPATLAATLVTFWRRNTRVLVLPPKIGEPLSRQRSVELRRVGED